MCSCVCWGQRTQLAPLPTPRCPPANGVTTASHNGVAQEAEYLDVALHPQGVANRLLHERDRPDASVQPTAVAAHARASPVSGPNTSPCEATRL